MKPPQQAMPDNVSEHHRQVLAALARVIEGQVTLTESIAAVLTELQKPVGDDGSFQRLEDLLQRTCDLLTLNMGDAERRPCSPTT